MILSTFILIAGLALLIAGAEALVRGASNLARAWGVSELLIGLTIVAFGTSAPELAINLIAAVNGSSDISFGNIVGSNIANIGLILGVAALIRPLVIQRAVIRREIPMMTLATVTMLALILDGPLSDRPDVLDRGDGIAMLLLFCVFLYYTTAEAMRQRADELVRRQIDEKPSPPPARRTLLDSVLILAGLVGLIVGGRMTVIAAVDLATALGLPEVFIALTLVALGTSLPELATSAVAAFHGQTDIAVGNVVGSNVFNLLLVLGLTGVVSPVALPFGALIDLGVMTGLSMILLPFAITNRGRLVRWEGMALLVTYFSYIAWRYLSLG